MRMDWTGCIEMEMPPVADLSDQMITARRYTEAVDVVDDNKYPFPSKHRKKFYPLYFDKPDMRVQ
jgi:hypothetical protein